MRRHLITSPLRSRRGSIYILVLAILAVLILLSMTLGYITKMDLMASRNWANTVQARVAAVSGVPLYGAEKPDVPLSGNTLATAGLALSGLTSAARPAQESLAPLTIRLTPGLDAAPSFAAAAVRGVIAQAQPGQVSINESLNPTDAARALATASIEDESAKININAVIPDALANQATSIATSAASSSKNPAPGTLSEAMLARFIAATLEARQIQDVDAPALAHAIAMRRLGRNGRLDTPTPADLTQQDPSANLSRAQNNSTPVGLTRGRTLTRTARVSGGRATVRVSRPDLTGMMTIVPQLATANAATTTNTASLAADPRLRPGGDDQPFTSIDELKSLPGLSLPAYQALAPYLTTFSVSFAAFNTRAANATPDPARGFPQVDPNTASPEAIYQVLRQRFPEAPEGLLGQFTANLIDRADDDSVPTNVHLASGTYYGIEINPCINEVCPQVSMTGNDKGQYLELFNPYSKAMSLQGWSLRGAGTGLTLSGSIPSGGYFVLTDDYNNEQVDTKVAANNDADGEGSFYNVFGVVPTGPLRQIKEFTKLELPDETGKIELVNAEGNVVDVFEYSNYRFTGKPIKSFQRPNPRLRAAELLPASPAVPNRNFVVSQEKTQALRLQEQWQNKPFRSALDVMLVCASWSGATSRAGSGTVRTTTTGDTRSTTATCSALPVLQASTGNNLDVRLVDCFRLGAEIPVATPIATDPLRTGASTLNDAYPTNTTSVAGGNASILAANALLPVPPRCATVLGAINLNTAPPAVLAALPGMTEALLGSLDQSRRPETLAVGATRRTTSLKPTDSAWWITTDPFATPRWANLSDLLLDESVWAGRPLYDRLDAVYPFWPLVTTHSMALRVVTANLLPSATTGQQDTSTTPRPTIVRSERILTGDRGAVETVTFRYMDPTADSQLDPDLMYAATAQSTVSTGKVAGATSASKVPSNATRR